MDVAIRDELQDQLAEVLALQEARVHAEEQARVEAELEAQRRAEAEAEKRRREDEEAQRRLEAEARAREDRVREAEAQTRLEALEAELRERLEREARVQEAETKTQLDEQMRTLVQNGVSAANSRTRKVAIASLVVLLAVAGVAVFVVKPALARVEMELERTRQTARILQGENEALEQEVRTVKEKLEALKSRDTHGQTTPVRPMSRPKQTLPRKRKAPARELLEPFKCDVENDPLCGVPDS